VGNQAHSRRHQGTEMKTRNYRASLIAAASAVLASCAAPPQQQADTYNYPQHVYDCREYVQALTLLTHDQATLVRASSDCLESRK